MKSIEIIQKAKDETNSSHALKIRRWLDANGLMDEFLLDAKAIHGDLDFNQLFYLVDTGNTIPICGMTKAPLRFASPSVGYRFCGPAGTCECARAKVAESVSNTKSLDTKEKKERISEKRRDTNIRNLGVVNPFQSQVVRGQILETNLSKYGVGNPQQNALVREQTKKTLLDTYGVDNAAKSPAVRAKIQSTNIERYGVHNAAQNREVQAKMAATMVERYGEPNANQCKEIRDKRQTTNMQRYGVSEPFNTAESRLLAISKVRSNFISSMISRVSESVTPCFSVADYQNTNQILEWKCVKCHNVFKSALDNSRVPICRVCNPLSISSGHRLICNKLDEWEIAYEVNNRSLIAPKEVDIFVPSLNIAIEYGGLHWHTEASGNKPRNYHLEKTNECAAKNVRLLTIWDDELTQFPERTFSRLRSILGITTQRVMGRKCAVREIETSTAKEFAITNHVMGHANASKYYGLYHGDMLVSLMSFAPSRFDRTGWEMIRYCSKYAVMGGAQKLLQQFLLDYPTGDLLSYADRRWSDGGLYRELGFTLRNTTTAGYQYVDSMGNRHHRLGFTKAQLVKSGADPSKTEWEIMQSMGFDRVWDCGQLVFVLKR